MKKRNCLVLVFVFLLTMSMALPVLAVYYDGPDNINYNRTEAAAYVAAYTISPNPAYMDYRNLGGDCTNFASQVLVAGGMQMTESVSNPSNTSSWYYYYDSDPGRGRTASWTGAHQFRQYWADVNGVGGQHAYEFIKYTARDFDDDTVWYSIYNYLEPGDIVQYVYGSNGLTYHTQIVHRTSYENGEYKVSMGQHSPFSWVNLRTHVLGLDDSTVICLIKIKNPTYSRAISANTLTLQTQVSLERQQDELFYTQTNSIEEENEKWASIAAIKNEMVSRAKREGYSYKEKITLAVLNEAIDARISNNNQIIAAYEKENTVDAAAIIEECCQENAQIQAFRATLPEDPNEVFDYWQYYWKEILNENAPSYFVE